jgi:hypothetical protein
MKRSFNYEQPASARRPLKVYAFDPMLGRRQGGRITIDIPNEIDLQKGPVGERIEVIDYDAVNRVFYAPINLNDQAVLMQNGLEPTESDPRFHQQMVYAVAMKVLENFDIALGRKLYFRFRRRLRIFPHAFQGANAFYDPNLKAVLFGYFRADERNPGPNIPGQTVFTCLSQDIIAHEMTHAVVDRLRPYFIEPTNRDVAAFHEGFSDIVAIFQHFTFPAILREHIQETRGNLHSPNNLIMLASEFGYATGQGQALRSALDLSDKNGKSNSSDKTEPDSQNSKESHLPDKTLYQTVFEPHERGSILVAAVFDAFFKTYQSRIKDLIRIATGGTGNLPDGDLHPDLVNRIAGEASRISQSILNMCIRAFEYLPPVDITFGDYLRALVTADYELSPNDETGQRAAIVEAFQSRGIYPENASWLGVDSLLWESPDVDLPPFPIDKVFIMQEILKNAYESSFTPPSGEKKSSNRFWQQAPLSEAEAVVEEDETTIDLSQEVVAALHDYAQCNAAKLHLDPHRRIRVAGFHPVFRVNPRGQLLVEMAAQFTQKVDGYKDKYQVSGGVNLRGGTTVIAAADGEVRYLISKPLEPSIPLDLNNINDAKKHEAKQRRERQEAFVHDCDSADARLAWADKTYLRKRIMSSLNFKTIHGGIKR